MAQVLTPPRPREGIARNDERWRPAPRGRAQALAAPLPRVTGIRFRNVGGEASDAANCCVTCPVNLGVGQGATASNGMELRFRIEGHRPGIEYDITRTRRNSLWERRAGVWSRLGSVPMGTNDDHHDDDECLRLTGGFIFAIDTPGWNGIAVPAADGTLFTSGLYGPMVTTHADAQDVVSRFSFAEWVIARSKGEGIAWTPLELPPLKDGTARRHVYWHSVMWLTRDGTNRWVIGPRSEIAAGSLSDAVINAAPV